MADDWAMTLREYGPMMAATPSEHTKKICTTGAQRTTATLDIQSRHLVNETEPTAGRMLRSRPLENLQKAYRQTC